MLRVRWVKKDPMGHKESLEKRVLLEWMGWMELQESQEVWGDQEKRGNLEEMAPLVNLALLEAGEYLEKQDQMVPLDCLGTQEE